MNKQAQELLYGKGGIEAFVEKTMGETAHSNMGIDELEEWISKNDLSIFHSIKSEVLIEEADIREKQDSGWFKERGQFESCLERIWVNGYCFDVHMEIWRNPENPWKDFVLWIPKSVLAMEIRRFLEPNE